MNDSYNFVLQGLNPTSIDYIMTNRLYYKQETRDYLLNNNILRYEKGMPTVSEMNQMSKWGILGENGRFFLENRFIIPIRDSEENIITYVGWEKDKSKYLTIPAKNFSKKHCWFNIDNALEKSFGLGSSFARKCVVVEGIFDALMLDMIGIPVIATMGYDVGIMKGELLQIFDKVVCLPDNDRVGRKAVKNWNVPKNSTFLFFEGDINLGGEIIPIKDMDMIVNYYDKDSILGIFSQVFELGGGLITMNI